jgi:hypothetical protein
MLFRAVLFFGSIIAALGSITATNCDTKSLFHVDSVTITPNGVNSTLNITYDVPAEVSDGVVKYSCTLNGIPVISESKPLCQDLKCPIVSGHHEDISSSVTPTVPGTLACTVKWQSVTSESLLCVKLINVLSDCVRDE